MWHSRKFGLYSSKIVLQALQGSLSRSVLATRYNLKGRILAHAAAEHPGG